MYLHLQDIIGTKLPPLTKKQLEAKEYMQSTNDWMNFEATGVVKFISGDSGDSWTWYGRGGHHTGSGFPDGCEGTAYKGDLFYGGKVRFAKEQCMFTTYLQASNLHLHLYLLLA